MNPSEVDWRYLLRHSLLPAVSAVVALVIFIASYWIHGRQDALYAQFSIDQEAVYGDYDELVYRRRLVDRYHRRYEQFRQTGFIGREQRLDWIETMRETTADLDLPSVSYALEPQREVLAPVSSELSGEDVRIYLSRLTLDVGLIHETDLLRFVDRIQAKAPGLISVDRCTLTRQSQSVTPVATEANIMARCSMQIYSVVTSDVSASAEQS